MPETAETRVRDRIVELRRVPASELAANPRNYRRHPAAQSRALQGLLDRVGYADALLARETEAGLELVDGHLRASLTPEETVPVLVLDIDEEEAGVLLASLDPIGAMAEVDPEALSALLDEVSLEAGDLATFLNSLAGAEPGERETAFLDAAVEAGGDAAAWSSEGPPGAYFTVQVAVTAEQRSIIRRAIEEAKVRASLETSAEALVEVAHRYLQEVG